MFVQPKKKGFKGGQGTVRLKKQVIVYVYVAQKEKVCTLKGGLDKW